MCNTAAGRKLQQGDSMEPLQFHLETSSDLDYLWVRYVLGYCMQVPKTCLLMLLPRLFTVPLMS